MKTFLVRFFMFFGFLSFFIVIFESCTKKAAETTTTSAAAAPSVAAPTSLGEVVIPNIPPAANGIATVTITPTQNSASLNLSNVCDLQVQTIRIFPYGVLSKNLISGLAAPGTDVAAVGVILPSGQVGDPIDSQTGQPADFFKDIRPFFNGCSFNSTTKAITFTNFKPAMDKMGVIFKNTDGTFVEVTLNFSGITSPVRQVLTRGNQADMNLASTFPGCGQNGFGLQRIWDCSKKIVNYGVTAMSPAAATALTSGSHCTPTDVLSATGATYTGTQQACDGTVVNGVIATAYYKTYTEGIDNPNNFWFVMSCPVGTGSNMQQECAWSSPGVKDESLSNNSVDYNPSFDLATTSTGTISTFFTARLPGVNGGSGGGGGDAFGGRIAFSGLMTNAGVGYTFAEANGFTVGDAIAYSYSVTGLTGSGGLTISGAIASAGANGFTTNGTYVNGSMSPAGICKNTSSDVLITGLSGLGLGQVEWRVPSYPMLHMLTRGTPATMTSTGIGLNTCADSSPTNGSTANCNSLKGFGAINIPGFADESINNSPSILLNSLWSSSASQTAPADAWYFKHSLTGGSGGIVDTAPVAGNRGVRCITVKWF